MLHTQLHHSHSINMVGHTAFGAQVLSPLIPQPTQYGMDGSSLPGSVPPSDTVDFKPVVCVKPGDSDLVTGYQVHEFTHTWLVKYLHAQSHIYPGFMGKVSTLTCFAL